MTLASLAFLLGLLVATIHPEPMMSLIRAITIGWFLLFGLVWSLRGRSEETKSPPRRGSADTPDLEEPL